MKKCTSCGAPIKEGTNFCSACGKPIINSPAKSSNSDKNRKLLIVAIAAALVVVLFIAVPFSLTLAKDSKVKSNTNLGNKYLTEGKYEEAILAFEKIISIDSKNIPARIGLAKASIAIKKYDKASKALDEVLALDKNHSEALKMLYDLYSLQAKEAIEAKKYDLAEEFIKKALVLDSKKVSFYISLSDLYVKQGELDRAIKLLETGINSTGAEELKSKLKELRQSSQGNTPSNIANGGDVVEKDNWLYVASTDGIYRVDKNNRNTKSKLQNTTGIVQYLNINNDYLFFSTFTSINNAPESDKDLIMRVALDGSNAKTLAEDIDPKYSSYLTLKNNRLYYINSSGNIISMNTEGEDRIVISKDICSTMSIGDEWIYYSNNNDTVRYTKKPDFNDDTVVTDMGKIYRVKLDGSGKEKFCEDGTDSITVDGEYIYYENGSDGSVLMSEGDYWYGGKLYRINEDGTNKKRILDYESFYANITDDWIYSYNGHSLVRIDKGSGSEQKIAEFGYGGGINTIENEVFFHALVSGLKYDYLYYLNDIFGFVSIKLDKSPTDVTPTSPDNGNTTENNKDFIISDSGIRKLTETDIAGLSKEQLGIARNEIYARHGYIFKTDKYKEYFSSKSWYIPNASFKESMLNEVEKYNAEFIRQHE